MEIVAPSPRADYLAFLTEIFAEQNEIAYSQARSLLDNIIAKNRASRIGDEAQTPANVYLNERKSGTTASRLNLVQDAVRDFIVAIDGDTELNQTPFSLTRELRTKNMGIGFFQSIELKPPTNKQALQSPEVFET